MGAQNRTLSLQTGNTPPKASSVGCVWMEAGGQLVTWFSLHVFFPLRARRGGSLVCSTCTVDARSEHRTPWRNEILPGCLAVQQPSRLGTDGRNKSMLARGRHDGH